MVTKRTRIVIDRSIGYGLLHFSERPSVNAVAQSNESARPCRSRRPAWHRSERETPNLGRQAPILVTELTVNPGLNCKGRGQSVADSSASRCRSGQKLPWDRHWSWTSHFARQRSVNSVTQSIETARTTRSRRPAWRRSGREMPNLGVADSLRPQGWPRN